jgi:hypothetical protein
MRGCVSLVIVRRGLAALKGERQLELERRLAGDAVKAAEAVFDRNSPGSTMTRWRRQRAISAFEQGDISSGFQTRQWSRSSSS